MNKIKNIFNRILKMNFKNMFKTVIDISVRTGKSRAYIIFDMLYCAFRYGAGYNDYRDCELYFADKEAKSTYLTKLIHDEIIEKYNDEDVFYIFDKKSEFNKKFDYFLSRKWIDLENIEISKFSLFIRKYPMFVVKGGNRKNHIVTQTVEFENRDDLYNLYKELLSSNKTIIEERLRQHPEMEALNPNGFNSVKVFTFVKNNKAYILQSVLKTEYEGKIMYAFANNEGKIITPACTQDGKAYDRHPATNINFVGFKIPEFINLKSFAKSAALTVKDAGYVCWDIAVTPNGFALISGNAHPEIIQPRASFNKGGNGVLNMYRRYMDI